jgi:hypothetical protein
MRLFLILVGLAMALPVTAASSLVFNNSATLPDQTVFLNNAVDVQIDLAAENGRGSVVVEAATNDLSCNGLGLETTADPGNRALLQIDLPGAGSLVYYVDADFSYDAFSTVLTVEPVGTLEVVCTSSVLFLNGFE